MPKSFLLVRFSAIGDCVMATWAATSIRQRYPDAKIVWAVERRCAPMIDTERLVSETIEFPRDEWKKRRGSPSTWADQIRTYRRLREHRFDFGLDLQGHSKTALCLRFASPKARLAVRATDALSAKLNPQLPAAPNERHTVENQRAALLTFGDFPEVELPIMPNASRPTGLPEGRLVTISVSAGHPSKAYSAEGWQKVASSLRDAGFAVAFLGGPTDQPVLVPGTTDLVGKLPLKETLGAVAASELHLAADTGTGHMAAALGIPVVSVFGPMSPVLYRPYTTRGTVLHQGSDPNLVTTDQILSAAHHWLEVGRG